MPKRIVFLGAKPIGYACLAYLLQHQKALDIEVAAIRTQTRTEFGAAHNIAQLAQEWQVPLLQHLDQLPPCDFIYSVQHHEILQQQHIDQAAERAVNLHLAPLPEYRGCNQFSFALLDDAPVFGVTIHQIDTQIDNGDILFEKRFDISPNTWVSDLYQQAVNEGIALFKDTLPDLLHGRLVPVKQQSLLGERTTSLHYRKEMQQLKQIDLNWSAEKIAKVLRATYMPGFEPPFAWVDGRKIHLVPEINE